LFDGDTVLVLPADTSTVDMFVAIQRLD